MGDDALVALARELQNVLRESDLVARFGGEEFVCLAICAGRDSAISTFERVRKRVESLILPVAGGELTLTVSIGVTIELSDSLEKMWGLADEALYEAEQSGRNRVIHR